MKKSISAFLIALLTAPTMFTSCSKMGAYDASDVTVTPQPLEVVGNEVPTLVSGRFKEKYFKKNATLTVTPVLRYQGGEAKGTAVSFQGESVKGNSQEVNYLLGGVFSLRDRFAYKPEMQTGDLYLTFSGTQGKKAFTLPEVKIASGVLATSTLLSRTATHQSGALAADAYRRAIEQRQDAQIKYLIQQSRIRLSELRTPTVEQFVQTLRNIKEDSKTYQLQGVDIAAYASPDGKTSLNTALAQDREKSSKEFVEKQLRRLDLDAAVNTRYTAEDWNGFQELVRQSNLQDKDVILRVLSMYDDPEQREQQIKNLSAGFRELADEILPELRRARLSVNYLVIGRSDDEILSQYAADASQLSVEELLYAATLVDTDAEKAAIYERAYALYPSDYRAANNRGLLLLNQGRSREADAWFDRALQARADAPEAWANKALIALQNGQIAEAEDLLSRATTSANYNTALGNLLLAKGSYNAAAQKLAATPSNSTVLAQILSKDYTGAAQTLKAITAPDATTSYLEAILCARTNQPAAAVKALDDAISLDASLKTLAQKDLEFSALKDNAAFRQLLQ